MQKPAQIFIIMAFLIGLYLLVRSWEGIVIAIKAGFGLF
jgi:hypothetical protein